MKNFLILATSAATLAIASPAFASGDVQCGNSGGQWMAVETAKQKATEMGYDVRRVKREDNCLEIYAIDQNGNRVELYMNPVSGEVVRIKNKS